eukprot:6045046-Amphidinium_carterae.1
MKEYGSHSFKGSFPELWPQETGARYVDNYVRVFSPSHVAISVPKLALVALVRSPKWAGTQITRS